MATSKAYLTFLLDQLSALPGVTARPMMGEYLLYCRDRLVACLCDNRLLVKPLPAARRFLPDAPSEPPYAGAKPMLLVTDVDDPALLCALFDALAEEAPPPKRKKQ